MTGTATRMVWVTELLGTEVRYSLTSASVEKDRQAQADQADLFLKFVQPEVAHEPGSC